MADLPPIAVGKAEAARMLSISPRTLERLVSRGELPPGALLGARRVYLVRDLEAAVRRLQQGAKFQSAQSAQNPVEVRGG